MKYWLDTTNFVLTATANIIDKTKGKTQINYTAHTFDVSVSPILNPFSLSLSRTFTRKSSKVQLSLCFARWPCTFDLKLSLDNISMLYSVCMYKICISCIEYLFFAIQNSRSWIQPIVRKIPFMICNLWNRNTKTTWKSSDFRKNCAERWQSLNEQIGSNEHPRASN